MLRSCSKEEFIAHIEFAYALATNMKTSGYPTYCDGIKTKAMFVERALKAFERETEEMLLFVYEDEVQGLIHYYWLPEDRYLQLIGFHVARAAEQALSEFLEYVGERFRGYDAYLGFPSENRSAVQFLAAQGFECIENDYNNTAFLDQLDSGPENRDVIQIRRENYQWFQTLHCQTQGDMYWDSERIYDALDDWIIFVRETDGKPQGAVYYRNIEDGWFEIFGIDIDHGKYDPALFMELLNAALSDAKRRNGRFMTFFCEEAYEAAAKACGFVCVGNYLCYNTHLLYCEKIKTARTGIVRYVPS